MKNLLIAVCLTFLCALTAFANDLTVGEYTTEFHRIPVCDTEEQVVSVLQAENPVVKLGEYNKLIVDGDPACGVMVTKLRVVRVVAKTTWQQWHLTAIEVIIDGKRMFAISELPVRDGKGV